MLNSHFVLWTIRACDLSGALSKDEQQIAGEQVFEETTCDPAIVFAVKSELMCVTAKLALMHAVEII